MKAVAIGDEIAQFRVIEPVGRDAWIAERIQDFRQRVLIDIAPQTESGPSNLRAWASIRLRIRQLSTLHHPCIPGLLQGGMMEGERPFAVFELAEGMPFVVEAEQKRLSIWQSVRLALECVNALATAHRQLIAHGALDSNHFLMDDAGHARLPAFPLKDSRKYPVQDDVKQIAEFLTRLVKVSAGKIPPDLREILARCKGEAGHPPYENCDALGEDLDRFLDFRPISGASRFGVHRLTLFARRKPGIFYPFFISALGLLCALGWSLWMEHVARRSQLEAEGRLRDLHRLTASLESDLFQSVRRIPNSETAQQNLIRWTADSLDRLAANANGDPAFRQELAGDYARLAEACQENGLADEAARLDGKEAAVLKPASRNR